MIRKVQYNCAYTRVYGMFDKAEVKKLSIFQSTLLSKTAQDKRAFLNPCPRCDTVVGANDENKSMDHN